MYGTCNRYVIWDYILLCPKLQLLLLLLPVHNDSITITITITKYPVIVTITITITYYYYPSPGMALVKLFIKVGNFNQFSVGDTPVLTSRV